MKKCKPVSRVLYPDKSGLLPLIYYKRCHLSLTTYPLTSDEQPYMRQPIWSFNSRGLPALPVTWKIRELLPHDFNLTCALRPSAVYFLRHFP